MPPAPGAPAAPAPTSPIPPVTIGPGPATASPANILNAVSSSAQQRQQQTAAENALLRLMYGRQMLGAQIADVLAFAGNLVIFAIWGRGPWQSLDALYLDDLAAPAGVNATHYLGTQSSPDGTLVAAYAAMGVTYTDVLAGIVYSVIVLPPGLTTGFPRITAICQGLKVYDPRDGTQTLGVSSTYKYSDNPALALADLQTNGIYGGNGAIDWTTVTTAANACDALVAGAEKRRAIGLVIDQLQSLDQWLEAMRAYAGCFLARSGAQLSLIPDRPASSSFTFIESGSGGNCRVRNLRRRTKRDVPTVSAVRYTDTSAIPWRDNIAYAYAAGALAGTVPWKVRDVPMQGVTRYSHALREATEQLNKLTVNDITLDVEGQDEALVVTVGDVITATANVGLSARLARVLNVGTPTLGRPVFNCEGYDPAVYSDAIIAGPSIVDTALPNPNQPPAVTGLTLTEELFQMNASGLYFSRIKAVWTPPATATFPAGFVRNYRIEISLAGAIVNSSSPSTAEYRTPQLSEGNTYNVNVWLISSTGVASPVASASLLVTGSPTVPSDVANFTARQIGGRVYMTWSFNPERDVTDYELRYGSALDWNAGKVITRTAGAQFIADSLPAGTWYFMAKARNGTRTTVNPNGAYSTNPASSQITLTLDTQFLVRAQYLFTTPSLSNMTEYGLQGDSVRYFITDLGDGVGFGADNTNNSVGTFGDSLVNRVLAAPHTSGTSEWLSETYDYGQALFGDWNWVGNVVALDGSAFVPTLQLKALIGDAWTDFTAFPARMAARYARLKLDALTTNTMLVKMDAVGPGVTLDVAYKSETFTVTTSATLPVTVTLQGKYSLYRAIPMACKGTTAKMADYNNVSLSPTGSNTFDVYAFNDAGAQVAVEVTGVFQGV